MTIVSKPEKITGIVDVICFESQSKPATKIYSNFNRDFDYDTIDSFIDGLVESGKYVVINVHCNTYTD